MDFGKAQVGDKTMVDVARPVRDALAAASDAGHRLADRLGAAAEARTRPRRTPPTCCPAMGRARPHAEKSLGTPDAGATPSR